MRWYPTGSFTGSGGRSRFRVHDTSTRNDYNEPTGETVSRDDRDRY